MRGLTDPATRDLGLAAHHHCPALARPARRGGRRRPARDPLRPRLVAALSGRPAHLASRVGGDGDRGGGAVRAQRAGLLVGAGGARRSGDRPRGLHDPDRTGVVEPLLPVRHSGARPRICHRDGAAGDRGSPRRRAGPPGGGLSAGAQHRLPAYRRTARHAARVAGTGPAQPRPRRDPAGVRRPPADTRAGRGHRGERLGRRTAAHRRVVHGCDVCDW